ncbi:hypothetical protein PHLGIDRAFT_19866 [Phlebiopsis gigantea 11061_1 CR5-6]|uniref:Uncharacterized protein n=1 Tax=Phlebiopsis gigantea (strain 11061_1 CR5-6) TaxID=745531 RepID=A0A0C3S471_PHLG1|nr:hypothetical protein PHLGIDRAFT_19866 [Phlebiopsis gigantea 11061_1 CR5-6]
MSYASVAAHNAPPSHLQPHPDPALLTTEAPSEDNIADDAAKLNIVAPDFKEHPATLTSTQGIPTEPEPKPVSGGVPAHISRTQRAAGAVKRYTYEAEEDGLHLWNSAKQHLLRPGVAGGAIGIVNVGLLSWAGYSLYTKPHLQRDTKLLASAAVAALALLSAEGYAAEKYRETPAGQEEERRAKAEGATLYRTAKEHLLRPGVPSGLIGVLNTAIVGTVGYFIYKNWGAPHWDRRVVSAVSFGLLTLWTGEGYLAEQYKGTQH